jgi:uncharacterized UPF0160 family protein
MRAFKAVTKESRRDYHTLFPGLVNYLLNVYYVDLESNGEAAAAAKAPQPDLAPIRPLISDLIRLLNDSETITDRESDDYQVSLALVEDQITALFVALLQLET